jgi:hypothetical protein
MKNCETYEKNKLLKNGKVNVNAKIKISIA